VGDQAAIDGCDTWLVVSSIFYADDGLLTSHNAEKLQSSYTLLCELFTLMNLNSSTEKKKSMVFLPQSVYDSISDVAYNRSMSGEGETYKSRKHRKYNAHDVKRQWYTVHWRITYYDNMASIYGCLSGRPTHQTIDH
jgi:hypothetical protein